MSLRLRFTLTVAAMAALATLFATTLSYRSTSQRLDRAVDESLTSAGTRMAQQMSSHGARLQRDDGDDHRNANDGTGRGGKARFPQLGPVTSEGPGQGPLPGGYEPGSELLAVQWIDTAGNVTQQPNLALPIDSADHAIAQAVTAQSTVRTVDIGTSAYRIRTVGVPREGAVMIGRNVNENRNVMRDLLRRFVLLVAGTSAAAALLSWMLARQATKRLLHLERVVTAMANTGDLALAEPLQTSGSDETAKVATAFDRLVRALITSKEQQHRLVQDASHELRTPLTSLRTNLSVLPRIEQLNIADRQSLLADVQSEVEELVLLVNELVEHATESGADEISESISLIEIAQRCAAVMNRRTSRTINVVGDRSMAFAGPVGVARAITNLLGNAIKFDASSLPIELTVARGTVKVRDHGPGIATEDLARVFDRFYRSEAARSLPGSGLGLSIVADVVRRCGGSVSASNADGGGAEITMTFPWNQQHASD
jgi:two-component system, OmpR family, sensor histidine kinase MprB